MFEHHVSTRPLAPQTEPGFWAAALAQTALAQTALAHLRLPGAEPGVGRGPRDPSFSGSRAGTPGTKSSPGSMGPVGLCVHWNPPLLASSDTGAWEPLPTARKRKFSSQDEYRLSEKSVPELQCPLSAGTLRETSCSEAGEYRNQIMGMASGETQGQQSLGAKVRGARSTQRMWQSLQQHKGHCHEGPGLQHHPSRSRCEHSQKGSSSCCVLLISLFLSSCGSLPSSPPGFPSLKGSLMTFEQAMLRMSLQSFLILWWRLGNVVMGTETLKNRQTDSEIRLDTQVI